MQSNLIKKKIALTVKAAYYHPHLHFLQFWESLAINLFNCVGYEDMLD